MCMQACGGRACCVCENAVTLLGWGKSRRASGDRTRGMSIRCSRGTLDGSSALIAGGFAAGASRPRRLCEPRLLALLVWSFFINPIVASEIGTGFHTNPKPTHPQHPSVERGAPFR